MLVPHGGLMVIVVLGIASSLTALDGIVAPGLWLALLTMAPPGLAVLAELVAYDARGPRLRTAALSIEALGAAVHIALQLGGLRAPWVSTAWELLLVVATANIVVMGLALRFALRSLALGALFAREDDLRAEPASVAHRIERELSLFGGTALSFTLCSAGALLLLVYTIAGSPEIRSSVLPTVMFFTIFAIGSVKFGLDRRARLLAIARTRA